MPTIKEGPRNIFDWHQSSVHSSLFLLSPNIRHGQYSRQDHEGPNPPKIGRLFGKHQSPEQSLKVGSKFIGLDFQKCPKRENYPRDYLTEVQYVAAELRSRGRIDDEEAFRLLVNSMNPAEFIATITTKHPAAANQLSCVQFVPTKNIKFWSCFGAKDCDYMKTCVLGFDGLSFKSYPTTQKWLGLRDSMGQWKSANNSKTAGLYGPRNSHPFFSSNQAMCYLKLG